MSDFQETAISLVENVIKERFNLAGAPVPEHSTYVVWFCKTLQNWKALVSTTMPDGAYYEVTYNGDENTAYVDSYKKFDNQSVVL